jgi:hypothetical protein
MIQVVEHLPEFKPQYCPPQNTPLIFK